MDIDIPDAGGTLPSPSSQLQVDLVSKSPIRDQSNKNNENGINKPASLFPPRVEDKDTPTLKTPKATKPNKLGQTNLVYINTKKI